MKLKTIKKNEFISIKSMIGKSKMNLIKKLLFPERSENKSKRNDSLTACQSI